MEVSVIIPVYQAEQYIERCLSSISKQSMRDFELILVDDGSSDSSPRICDEYALNNTEAVVFHKGNGGASLARNIGIEYSLISDSNWISFIDADDWIHSEYLKVLYSVAESDKMQIVMCNAVQTDNARFVFDIDTICKSRVFLPETLWCKVRNLCVVPWGKLFKKPLFRVLRFPEGIIQEDEVISYQVLFSVGQISFIDAPMYVYFQTPNSVMRCDWSPKKLSGLDALEEQIEFFKKNGYLQAMRESANTYLYLIHSYIHEIDNSIHRNELLIYKPFLNNRLKLGIQRYHNDLRLPVKGNEWVYALAYPTEMKLYYCLRKIKRIMFK